MLIDIFVVEERMANVGLQFLTKEEALELEHRAAALQALRASGTNIFLAILDDSSDGTRLFFERAAADGLMRDPYVWLTTDALRLETANAWGAKRLASSAKHAPAAA